LSRSDTLIAGFEWVSSEKLKSDTIYGGSTLFAPFDEAGLKLGKKRDTLKKCVSKIVRVVGSYRKLSDQHPQVLIFSQSHRPSWRETQKT
jgi:hypothetical protein